MNIAIIGCGAVFEAFYLEVLIRIQAQGLIKVAMLVDSFERNTQKVLKHFPGAKTAHNLESGFRSQDIDRAIVLTPPSSHAPILLRLADAGIHVYCEKPLAISPQEAELIAKAFSSRDLLCKVGYVRRLFPNFQAFKGVYAKLDLPCDFTLSDGEVFRWPIKTGSIFSSQDSGSGVVWDKLCHNLDIVQWIAGLRSIRSVDSSCRPGQVPTDILVDGTTDSGKFRVAVSWTASLANMISANDGVTTIQCKNGLGQSPSVDSTRQISGYSTGQAIISSYNQAVAAALDEFFRLDNRRETSLLATAEESVILTNFLAKINASARKVVV